MTKADMKVPNKDGHKTEGRGAGGRFAPGNKASPGRPLGRGAVAEMRDALAADLGGIIETVRAKAMAGDMQAARIILDRLVPSLRPVEIPTAVSMPAGATLAAQAQAVIEAAANGSLAAGQAAQIVTALGGVAKIIETTELVRRVEALEAMRVTELQGQICKRRS